MRMLALCTAAVAAVVATTTGAGATPTRTTRSGDCNLPGVTIIVTPGQPGTGVGGMPGKPGSVTCIVGGGGTSSGSSSSTASGGSTTQTLSSTSTTAVVKTTPQTFGGASATVTSRLVAPQGAGLAPGAMAISVTVTGAGEPFAGPIDVAFPGAPSGAVPAWSRSGSGWMQLGQLSGTSLGSGLLDGWYRDGDTIHVLTRHAGEFGLANAAAQAPFTMTVICPATLHLTKPWLPVRVGPSTSVSVSVSLLRNAKPVATWQRSAAKTTQAPLRLLLPRQARRPGNYTVKVTASAGGRSVVQSRRVVFVR